MTGRDERTIPAQPALDGMDHLQPLKQATILQYGLKTKNATIPQSRDPVTQLHEYQVVHPELRSYTRTFILGALFSLNVVTKSSFPSTIDPCIVAYFMYSIVLQPSRNDSPGGFNDSVKSRPHQAVRRP